MKKIFIAVLVAASILASGCTDKKETVRVLEASGFTDVQLTGYGWFACSEDDTFATAFIAKGPTGLPVRGTVCSGLIFKNSTIRFN